jgi:hypothetical protein
MIMTANRKFWEELIAYFPLYKTGHIENDTSNNSSIVVCLFVTVVTFLQSHCLATIGRFLPSCCLAKIRGFLPSRCLATIGEFLSSRCLATIRGIHTHRQQLDLISLLLFFQNKESRLKIDQLLPLKAGRWSFAINVAYKAANLNLHHPFYCFSDSSVGVCCTRKHFVGVTHVCQRLVLQILTMQ